MCPLPGMTVSPSEGVVPVGGQVDITVLLTPAAVMKFHTRVKVRCVCVWDTLQPESNRR